jgi:FkbM family methyltransferase
MLNQLKSYFKRFPYAVSAYETVVKLINNARNEIRDIRDSYVRNSRKSIDTPYGFRLKGSNSSHHRDMQSGIFEKEETALMRQHISQSDIFIDVGANIGFYSCLARSLGKHVISVEPLSRNLGHLYDNLIDNNWNDVEVFPIGLSDKPGLAILYGASSTGASLIRNWAGASQRFKRIIALSTLDILLSNRFEGQKLFIKIDVEGMEYPVLLGATRTLTMASKPTWLLEICLNEFYPTGVNPNYLATFELFWQYGYEVRTADHNNRLVKPSDVQRWVKVGRCESGVINYIFTPT